MDLKVLAKDDTWGAPTLLVANVKESSGKALFSQVIFACQKILKIFKHFFLRRLI